MTSSDKKWYYIVKFSGAIIELHIEPEAYMKLMKQWTKGDLIAVKSLNGEPLGVNATSISDIYPETDYLGWVDSANPRNYVRHGIWYASRDHAQFRIEPWRQKKIDEQKKRALREAEDQPLTDEQKKKNAKFFSEMKIKSQSIANKYRNHE